MKAALINSNNYVVNVIVWDDTCTAPAGTTAIVVENDVLVSPGWSYIDGQFTPPQEAP